MNVVQPTRLVARVAVTKVPPTFLMSNDAPLARL